VTDALRKGPRSPDEIEFHDRRVRLHFDENGGNHFVLWSVGRRESIFCMVFSAVVQASRRRKMLGSIPTAPTKSPVESVAFASSPAVYQTKWFGTAENRFASH